MTPCEQEVIDLALANARAWRAFVTSRPEKLDLLCIGSVRANDALREATYRLLLEYEAATQCGAHASDVPEEDCVCVLPKGHDGAHSDTDPCP
jgi:hypothetical protein